MNKLVIIALRRPYTFVVLAILVVLFGIQSVLKSPTDVFPNIKIPVTSVVWSYDGLLPKDVEGRITYIFERFLTSTVEGIKYIHSHSYFGSSIINIFLQDGIDLGIAEGDITAISQTVVKALPPDISPPMVMKLAPSQVPVAMLQVTSDTMTPAELYNLSMMRIRPLLVTIPGAILPQPYGGQDMQVMVNLDQQKLLARHLTPADVHKALSAQNLVLPGGDIKIKATDWVVLSNASALNLDDFNNIPIKREGNAFIYLRDVADVRLSGRVQTNAVLVDGKQAVMIVVMKSSEASTLEVVDGIKKMIPRIEKVVPEGVKIKLINDASTFVKDSIADVVHEMATAAGLVGLIVLLLLGSWRPTLIIATTIPLSILISVIALHALGQSINVMTLGGLALAVGVLVDNATVTIENIDTHIHMGKPLETAIIDASNQIVLPTFVATLAIAIVWLPLFQLTGVSGSLFMPMAEAIIFAMLASYILSFTLLPTMAKYLLVDPNAPKAHPHPGHPEIDASAEAVYRLTNREAEEDALHDIGVGGTHFAEPLPDPEHEVERARGIFGRFQQNFERGFNRLRERYTALLERVIARRVAFVGTALGLALLSLSLFYFNGRDFFPEIKSGTLQMHMRAPLGTRIEVAGRIASLVAKDIAELLPGQVEGVISNCGLPISPHNLAFIPTPTIGAQDCDLTISLKDEKSPVWDYRRILRKGLKERYPGTEFTFQPADLTAKILNFGSAAPIDVQINGPDIDANYEFARKLAGKLRLIPGASDVVIQQTMRTPTLLVEANRSFGLGVNLTQKDFGDNLLMTTAGSQQVDQQYWLDRNTGMSYRINVYTPQPKLTSLNDLLTVPVDRSEGEGSESTDSDPNLLGNVARLSAIGTPGVITHGNIMPLFDIYVSAEGRDLGAVLADVQKTAHSMEKEMPRSAELEIKGQAETMHETYGQMIGGLIAAIVLVYLLIVINFQSWLDPFIIISALPGALAGIAWCLFLTHTNISTPALTGAIMTMGTATANSILVVAYARERLEWHGDALRAAIEAGTARFRPVLMTAAAMIIGMLPMSMGNSQNAPLGRAVIGGLTVATVFTVFFVPCVYAILYHRRAVRNPKESPHEEPA
ncbi:efflux RND transporter permease subunit [Candidatus Methylocalor cossyra]|uniref:RND transporter n=1 Tax=Candidatus Methylocalor cossyra TaxID=3108543 RepID=A0ABP1C7N7_9GAMM